MHPFQSQLGEGDKKAQILDAQGLRIAGLVITGGRWSLYPMKVLIHEHLFAVFSVLDRKFL